MSLIPIKLLKNKPAKERLLLLKGETNDYIDDVWSLKKIVMWAKGRKKWP